MLQRVILQTSLIHKTRKGREQGKMARIKWSPNGVSWIEVEAPLKEVLDASGYLFTRVSYFMDFVRGFFRREKLTLEAIEEVGVCRKRLLKTKVLRKPMLITLHGTFAPCALLSAGWWERSARTKKPEVVWRDPVQEWLFHGFEQWGPSWDISLSTGSQTSAYLFAQLGDGDEVNSLPVIIAEEKAKTIRESLLDEWMVFEADITGLLCHRTHLSEAHLTKLSQWGRAFDYCMLLSEDDKLQGVSRCLEKTQIYSGYLWQCLAPKKWLETGRLPHLNELYFIWEHTNFANPDAIKYNLDSLEHKSAYLRSMYGDLILLQKSSGVVPGDPRLPTEEFYKFILQGVRV